MNWIEFNGIELLSFSTKGSRADILQIAVIVDRQSTHQRFSLIQITPFTDTLTLSASVSWLFHLGLSSSRMRHEPHLMRDVEKDLNFCSTVLAAPEGGRFWPLKKRFRSRVFVDLWTYNRMWIVDMVSSFQRCWVINRWVATGLCFYICRTSLHKFSKNFCTQKFKNLFDLLKDYL